MTEPLRDEDTLRYLLDDFTAEEAAAFRAWLASHPDHPAALRVLGDELRTWSEGQYPETAPPPHVWEAIDEAIGATAPTARPALVWWTLLPVWRTAAIVLLALNLGWMAYWAFFRPSSETTDASTASVAVSSGRGTDELPSDAIAATVATGPRAPGVDAAALDPDAMQVDLREKEVRILELREALVASQRTARLAQQDRDHLAGRLNIFFQPQEGRSQLTLIEMRPSGADRLNLVDDVHLAILDEDETTPPDPTVETPEGRDPGFDAIDASDAFGTPAADPSATPPPAGEDVTDPDPEISPEESEPTAETAQTPESEEAPDSAALAIWRDDLQQGFVNLYGLPDPTEGNHYTLWTRASEADAYIPVGVLPPPEDGVLLIDFTVDQADFHPSDILVTEESTTGATQPSERIVLHGP